MKLPHRRQFLHLAAGAAALPSLHRVARAQTYPSRPVRIFVGFAAGGGQDIVARMIAQVLSERVGQQFLVENRPGGGTNIATEAVVRSPADGYTLLFIGPSAAINTTLYDKLNFNFVRDIEPVAGIIRLCNVVVVHPSFPAKSVPEFIAYAKANPGKVNMASSGTGASPHVSGELFKMMAGVDMVHVPYRGMAPALTDLLGGQVQVSFSTITGAMEFIRAGSLRALAVTASSRLETLPDIPAVAEFVPGYESSSWYGVGAPRNTSSEIVEKLNKEITAVLDDAKLKAQLEALGSERMPMMPAEFGKLIVTETEKWAKVVRAANIRPE